MIAVLWKYYKAKDGLFPIRIRSTNTTGGVTKVTYQDTGIRVAKHQFFNGLVRNHPDQQKLNFKLASLCNQSPEQKTFLQFFKEFKEQPHGYYHKRKLNNIYRMIEKRNPKMTLEFIMRLERELVAEGKHPNYIADIMVRIKTVVNLMVKSGAMEYHKNPFLHFKVKQIKTEKKRLTFDELLVLQNANLSHLKGPELARNMYVSSYYEGGVRFGDLCRLTKSNVQKGRLLYTMNKTSQERNLPLNHIVESILKKYNYQFPLNIDWANEEKSINAKNALMNKHLKAACRAAGVPEVTFHTSRHSIADYAVKKKLTSKQIQGLLGHGRLTTTETYLKSFYREETDSGLKDLFS